MDFDPSTPRPLVSQAAYAEHRGVSRQRVHELVVEGRIPLHDGRIDPVEADRVLAESLDPARNPRMPAGAASGITGDLLGDEGADDADDQQPATNGSFSAHKALREKYAAQKAKLDYELASGAVVSTEAVQAAIQDCAAQALRYMERLIDRIAQPLAAQTDADKVHELLTREIHRAFEDLSKLAKTLGNKPNNTTH